MGMSLGLKMPVVSAKPGEVVISDHDHDHDRSFESGGMHGTLAL